MSLPNKSDIVNLKGSCELSPGVHCICPKIVTWSLLKALKQKLGKKIVLTFWSLTDFKLGSCLCPKVFDFLTSHGQSSNTPQYLKIFHSNAETVLAFTRRSIHFFGSSKKSKPDLMQTFSLGLA